MERGARDGAREVAVLEPMHVEDTADHVGPREAQNSKRRA
jgi:hypothetical protein